MYDTAADFVRAHNCVVFGVTVIVNFMVILAIVAYFLMKRDTTAMYNNFCLTMAIINITYSFLYYVLNPGYVVHKYTMYIVFLGFEEYSEVRNIMILSYWVFVVLQFQNLMNPLVFILYRHRTITRLDVNVRPRFSTYIYGSLLFCGLIASAIFFVIYLGNNTYQSPETDEFLNKLYFEKVKYITLPEWTSSIPTFLFVIRLFIVAAVPIIRSLAQEQPIDPTTSPAMINPSTTLDLIVHTCALYFMLNIPIDTYLMIWYNFGLNTGLLTYPVNIPTVWLPAILPLVIFLKVRNYRKTATRGFINVLLSIHFAKINKKVAEATNTVTEEVTD